MLAEIFGLDGVVVLIVVVAVLFGSTQIPKLARSLGSARSEFKKGLAEVHDPSADADASTGAHSGVGPKPIGAEGPPWSSSVPPKLLMILVIALIVLGPGQVALHGTPGRRDVERRSSGGAPISRREVRATFPDLPSTTEIAQAVRSPISMLDRLADEHGATTLADTPGHGIDAGPRPGANFTSGETNPFPTWTGRGC